MKLFVIAVATAIIAPGAHAQNTRVLEPEARRKLLIQERPPGKLPSPCPVLDRRMEHWAVLREIRTPIASRRELRAARADLRVTDGPLMLNGAVPSIPNQPGNRGSGVQRRRRVWTIHAARRLTR
jgi:hypothetical protein